MRLFVALELPAELRRPLVDWQRAIVKAGDGELRATPTASLHVTLVFIGHQAEKDLSRIEAAFETIASRSVAFSFEAHAVPKPARRPHLYAVGLRDARDVERLRDDLVVALASGAGYDDEKRVYWPHVTLCRVKSRVKRHVAPDELPGPPAALRARFESQAMTLFRSDLQPSGAVHTPIASLALKQQ